jgi:hypothetical protein
MRSNDLICPCGSMMISDGDVWACPWMGELLGQHSPPVQDKRVTICRTFTAPPRVGKPGPPRSKSQVRRKPKLHAGIMAACETCSPATAGYYKALLAKIAKREKERRA